MPEEVTNSRVADPPWDMSPANDLQVEYARTLSERLARKDWSEMDTTVISQVIQKLNSVCRQANIPFEPF